LLIIQLLKNEKFIKILNPNNPAINIKQLYDNIKNNEIKEQLIIYFLFEDINLIDDILNILIKYLQNPNVKSTVIDNIKYYINEISNDNKNPEIKKLVFDLIIEFLDINRQFEKKLKYIYEKVMKIQTTSICILQWFQSEFKKKNENSKLLFKDLLLYLINKEELLKIKIVKEKIKEEIFKNLFTIFTDCTVKSLTKRISNVFRFGIGGKTHKNKIKNITNRTYKNHIQK